MPLARTGRPTKVGCQASPGPARDTAIARSPSGGGPGHGEVRMDNFHTICIHQVVHTVLGARRQGLDVDALLERAGIVPALLDAPLG